MCDNCEPPVDYCYEDECGTELKGLYVKGTKFYVGDKYCRHLAAEHGHPYAEWMDIYE